MVGEKKVVAKLSIIVAPNKRGEIVIREGQEDPETVALMIKNFIVCYGLKRDLFGVISQNLQALIQNYKEEQEMAKSKENNNRGGQANEVPQESYDVSREGYGSN